MSFGSPVLSILLSKDRRYLLFGCGDGEISVLTDPNYTTKAAQVLSTMSQAEPGTKAIGEAGKDSIREPKEDSALNKSDNQPFIMRKSNDVKDKDNGDKKKLSK